MRIFTAAMVTETNSFSPFPTGWKAFEACGICWNEEDYREDNFFTECVLHVRRLGERDGHEVVLGLSAYADPAGPTLRPVYEELRGEILRRIEGEGPFDAVILTLHGAMVAEGYDDCEGDLLGRVRALVGPDVFIGAMLDPHCHLSAAMVRSADAITIMKEYPHVDGKERLDDLYRIVLQVKAGGVRPVSALVDCRMVGVWPTMQEPIRSLVDNISRHEAEQPILAIGFAHGFPWGDVADGGARVLVTANGSIDAAEAAAHAVADEIWAMREQARFPTVSIDQALAEVESAPPGLIILADIADNPGGGAPGDSTFLLRAVLNRGLRDVGIALIHDPASVELCRDAGVGASLDLRIGGKLGAVSGEPVALRAVVRGYSDHHLQHAVSGAPLPLGRSAWIEAEAEGVHMIITESRFQVVSPSLFTGLGLDPAGLRAVILKSTNHFRAGFEPIAARIISVGSPGALSPDFAAIPYKKRSADYWPRCMDIDGPRTILKKA